MTTIQHSDLPNDKLHEPKHILTSTTADAGKVITPSSVTSGTSQLRYLDLDDISNSGVSSWTGWAQYAEGTLVTEPGANNFAATTRTKLTIDGTGTTTNTTGLPAGVASLWDAVNNKITPAALNDAYDIRLVFVAKCTTSGAYLDVDLDIGGSLGVVATQSIPFLKSTDQYFQVNIPIFCAATFLSNGGEFWITASHACKIWAPQVLLVRTHKGS